jgi:enoyl-CoA hydratase
MTLPTEKTLAEAGVHRFIRVSRHDRVGAIQFYRPEALNALNAAMVAEIAEALVEFEADPGIGCMLIRGLDHVFCAGADIKAARAARFPDTYLGDFLAEWDAVARVRKPMVAAVAGHVLGGGCEIAMMCDVILAAETARFALPEIRLGVMPGAGGTQRIALALGKAKAMDLCLTGRPMLAEEAERLGLVSRILPADGLDAEALSVAQTIAGASLPAAMAIKEATLAAFDGLAQGLRLERRLFQSLFATEDRAEGMAAFAEKRTAVFRHR